MTNSYPDPTLVQLVFFGEIVSGHAPDEARRKLAAAVGIAPEQIESVFSGRRIVLKKSLSADEAPRYLAKLARIGIVARAEAQPDSSSDAAPRQVAQTGAAPSNGSPASASLALVEDAPRGEAPAPVEEVVCPKCGTRQPKRTLCLSCSTDMPRYAAAQKVLQEEQRASRLASLKGSANPASPAGEADQA